MDICRCYGDTGTADETPSVRGGICGYRLGCVGMMVMVMGTLGCGASRGCNSENGASLTVMDTVRGNDAPSGRKRTSHGGRVEDEGLVKAGRALAFGRLDEADALLEGRTAPEGKVRFLRAKVGMARKDWQRVVDLLSADGVMHEELAFKGQLMLMDAWAAMSRYENALSVCEGLLAEDNERASSHRQELEVRRAEFLVEMARYQEAVAAFDVAMGMTKGATRESLAVKKGAALLAAGNTEDGVSLLSPLAFRAQRGSDMERALSLLQGVDRAPVWTEEQQMERISTLMEKKRWTSAQRAMDALAPRVKGTLAKELRWQQAQLLFNRRRHYKEAVTALEAVMADGSPHAASAEFLRARALSRLDRDVEAIEAFRRYAARVKGGNRGRALFLAGRLEYYLGHHDAAQNTMEDLVGKGARGRASVLPAGQRRDAHFIAGMSAFLEQRYGASRRHMAAASRGTSSEEARVRNRYWEALSLFHADPETGTSQLEALCAADESGWYSLWAGVRLRENGVASDVCVWLPERPCDDDTCRLSKEVVSAKATEDVMALLDKVSDRGALYASMGLFRSAAKVIRQVELNKKAALTDANWVTLYTYLDAPQYAIRRASVGLRWRHRQDDDAWRLTSAYPTPYRSLVREQETRHDLPPTVVFAIARKESLFDPFARSHVGAMGMMQMMPATYETNRKRAGLPPLDGGRMPNPAESIVAGAFELAFLLDRYDGNLPLAIMGYNGGVGGVDRWLERSGEFPMDVFVEKAGFTQTRNYVRRVYSTLYRYRVLYGPSLPYLPRTARFRMSDASSKNG